MSDKVRKSPKGKDKDKTVRWDALAQVSRMNQVHLTAHHLAEYIEQDGMACGLLSEQAGESLHSDFQKLWLHYQVKDHQSPTYGNNLLRAVVAYNSSHV